MPPSKRSRRLTWPLIVAGLLAVLAPLASAAGVVREQEKPRLKLNTADTNAARAAVLRRSDLGAGWAGGEVQPKLTPDSCPSYQPKQSDLVVTGAAAADFNRRPFTLAHTVAVMQSRRMVELDWRRTVTDSRVIPCERYVLAHSFGSGAKLLSFRRAAFPQLTNRAREYRALISLPVSGGHVRMIFDSVLIGRNRTEMTLNAAGPATAKSALTSLERQVVRKLVARIR